MSSTGHTTTGEHGSRIGDFLRRETVGGVLLLVAAVIAAVWANVDYDSYNAVRTTSFGPESLHLHLTLETWAKDGLLAVFFLVVGLELKHEFTVGDLSRPAEAVLPMLAAIGGMVAPALLYVALNASTTGGSLDGWAVPTATDIAFALAVLAVIGSHLPAALRTFLLTLAVVDDLLAIIIIALFFTDHFNLAAFVAALVLLTVYGLLQRANWCPWPLAVAIGVAVWVLLHAAGIHATIAGVAMGLLTSVRVAPGQTQSPVSRAEHLIRPFSAGVCVPIFALFAAGVPLNASAMGDVLTSPISLGIILGLVVGKPLGITLGSWLAVRFTGAQLAPGIVWRDVAAIGALAGIGFTVSLLIAELAFPGGGHGLEAALAAAGSTTGANPTELAKAAVLTASVTAALLACIALGRRNAHYRRQALGTAAEGTH